MQLRTEKYVAFMASKAPLNISDANRGFASQKEVKVWA